MATVGTGKYVCAAMRVEEVVVGMGGRGGGGGGVYTPPG